jgi:murein DD-endopeptidase MepM/ murein hydrolase activator NlpD
MKPFCQTNFTGRILALNCLTARGFKAWVVQPGMGFADPGQWWGAAKARPSPHEGLDLRAFRDKDNNEQPLPAGTIVPPLFRGRVVRIVADFLGRTIIVDHGNGNRAGPGLYGFYAHLNPLATVTVGTDLKEDEGLGTIAAGNLSCPPHLHLSTVWIGRDFPLAQVGWADFTARPGFQPCDPLLFL